MCPTQSQRNVQSLRPLQKLTERVFSTLGFPNSFAYLHKPQSTNMPIHVMSPFLVTT